MQAGKINFYGRDFLIERPILKAISGKKRYILLLDEVEKASEEIEYTLLEVLENFSISHSTVWYRDLSRRDASNRISHI